MRDKKQEILDAIWDATDVDTNEIDFKYLGQLLDLILEEDGL